MAHEERDEDRIPIGTGVYGIKVDFDSILRVAVARGMAEGLLEEDQKNLTIDEKMLILKKYSDSCDMFPMTDDLVHAIKNEIAHRFTYYHSVTQGLGVIGLDKRLYICFAIVSEMKTDKRVPKQMPASPDALISQLSSFLAENGINGGEVGWYLRSCAP